MFGKQELVKSETGVAASRRLSRYLTQHIQNSRLTQTVTPTIFNFHLAWNQRFR
jgi:hypothetical protein